MNDKVKKLIEECWESKGETLDLSGCELKEIPKEISGMVWLKSLILHSNQISNIKGLEALVNLQNLYLSSNQISEIKGLEVLVNLQTLSLSSNQISEIKGLEVLVNLQNLYLNSNQISEIKGLEALVNLQSLSFYTNLISEIKGLEALVNLQTLNLNSNQISEIKGLEALVNLQTLNLNSNQISEIKGLEALVNLQSLSFYTNLISEIKGLETLVNLRSFSIQSNQISEIKGLSTLVNLQSLSFFNNQISEIKELDTLVNLQSFSIQNNQISEIKELETLVNLESLYLNNNQISNIKGLDALVNLQTLYLNSNQISDIKKLDALVNLQTLYLNSNQISEIKGLTNQKKLQYLDLSENEIIILPLDNFSKIPIINLSNNKIQDLSLFKEDIINGKELFWSKPKSEHNVDKKEDYVKLPIGGTYKKGIYVNNCNSLKSPPVEFVQLGPKVAQSYFQAIDVEEKDPREVNEIKVILIGDGGAGKTSLAYRLAKPKEVIPSEEARTRGVEVYNWDFEENGKKYRANIWDFGGQTIYEAVHQYFFSGRALYIFLEGTRAGGNQAIDAQTDWFMRSAELFGGNSPMLYVQNQHNDFAKNVSYDKYKEHYPFLDHNYYPVNLKSRKGLRTLTRAIKDKIIEHESIGMIFPNRWYEVRERIADLAKKVEKGEAKDPMDLEDFQTICQEQGIENEEAQLQLARYFHRLGVFLYYDNEDFIALKNKIILNRNWATKATYQVYDDKKIEQKKGRFGKSDIVRLWNEPEFKKHKPEILELMEIFKICFKLPNGKDYIVPRRLDNMPTDIDYCQSDKEVVPFFYYYEYDFMPAGVVNALSINKNALIKGENKDCVWADGVVFEIPEKNLIAEIREKRLGGEQKIEIRVIGDDIPFMADMINLELDSINAGLNKERLKIEVKIPCNCQRCEREKKDKYFFDYNLVKGHLLDVNQNKRTMECQKSLKDVPMLELIRELSHSGIAEIKEAEKVRKSRFRGIDKISEGLEELEEDRREAMTKSIQKENKKQTTELKTEVLNKILPAIRQALSDSDKELLNKIMPRLEEADFHREHTNDLIAIVGKAMGEIYKKQSDNFELTQEVQKVCKQLRDVKDAKSYKDKLKVTIPIIPFALKYEGELTAEIFTEMKQAWKEGGWKRLFVEK